MISEGESTKTRRRRRTPSTDAQSASGLKRIAPNLSSASRGTAKNIASITCRSEGGRIQNSGGEKSLKFAELFQTLPRIQDLIRQADPRFHSRRRARNYERCGRVDRNQIPPCTAVAICQYFRHHTRVLHRIPSAQFVERGFPEPKLIRKQMKFV